MKDKPKKSPGSTQHRFCCTGDVLRQYKFESMTPEKRTSIYQHLKQCRACRDTYRALLPESFDEYKTDISNPRFRDRLKWLKKCTDPVKLETIPRCLLAGQVWTTCPPSKAALGVEPGAIRMGVPVLIIHPGNKSKMLGNRIRAMSLSPDIEFHRDGETYLLEKGRKNPLGYQVLVELFNELPVSARQLINYRGTIPDSILKEIKAIRNSQRELVEIEKNAEFNKWKSGEIDASRYLSASVTYELWDDEEHIIILQDYRLAADTDQVRLSEIQPQIIADTNEFSLITIQIRDKLTLRFFSETYQPSRLRINGNVRKWKKTQDCNTWEITLGQVNQLIEEMTVSFSVSDKNFIYQLRFIPPESGGG